MTGTLFRPDDDFGPSVSDVNAGAAPVGQEIDVEPMDRPRAHPLDVLVAWSLAVIVALGVAGVALWRPLAGHGHETMKLPPAAALVASPTGSPRARIVATARALASTAPTTVPTLSPAPTPTPTPTVAAPATAVPVTTTPAAVLTVAPIASPAAPTLVVAVATATATATASASPAATFVYVVRAGETLAIIAARYGTTIDVLAVLNDLADPDVLAEGQELLIPTGP